mmetsp:Transcript_3759/g.9110  ORF Transcript_3759/g.9110 Transcript_3759/m.9110 type:complete len:264 (+) Transcript_3759:1337-2128(+)
MAPLSSMIAAGVSATRAVWPKELCCHSYSNLTRKNFTALLHSPSSFAFSRSFRGSRKLRCRRSTASSVGIFVGFVTSFSPSVAASSSCSCFVDAQSVSRTFCAPFFIAPMMSFVSVVFFLTCRKPGEPLPSASLEVLTPADTELGTHRRACPQHHSPARPDSCCPQHLDPRREHLAPALLPIAGPRTASRLHRRTPPLPPTASAPGRAWLRKHGEQKARRRRRAATGPTCRARTAAPFQPALCLCCSQPCWVWFGLVRFACRY